MTTLLLLRAGYGYVPYASLERVIEENELQYYAALGTAQLAMREAPSSFGAWLIYFLRALRAQQQSLEAKLNVETPMLQLSGVQQQIVSSCAQQDEERPPPSERSSASHIGRFGIT